MVYEKFTEKKHIQMAIPEPPVDTVFHAHAHAMSDSNCLALRTSTNRMVFHFSCRKNSLIKRISMVQLSSVVCNATIDENEKTYTSIIRLNESSNNESHC